VKKRLMKLFAPLLALLIVASLGVFPVTTVADKDNQDETLDFMKQVLPIDLSKYKINLNTSFALVRKNDTHEPAFNKN